MQCNEKHRNITKHFSNPNIFRLTIAAVFIILASSILIVSAVSDSDDSYADTRGEFENGLTWTCVDETLRISKSDSASTGAMNDFTDTSKAPWSSLTFTGVVLESGVTSIGNYAFKGCTSLNFVITPNGLTSIGNSAFLGCTNLKSVSMQDGLTSIGDSAFKQCSSLTAINMPNSVTSIGASAFEQCSGLTCVTVPGAESLNDSTFRGCVGLKNVTLAAGVKNLGPSVFEGCTNLENISLLSVASIDRNAFKDCTGLTSVAVGSYLTTIGESAFLGCTNLTDLVLSGVAEKYNAVLNAVTEWDSNQFNGMSSQFKRLIIGEYVDLKNLTSDVNALLLFTKDTNKDKVKVTGGGPYHFLTDANLGGSVYKFKDDGSSVLDTLPEHKQCVLEFDANGGSCMSERVTLIDLPVNLPTPEKSGYNFNGWYVAQDLSGAPVSTPYVAKDVKLYAKYTEITCTVTFDANGGTPDPASQTAVPGKIYGNLPTVTRDGYTFNGWYFNGTKVTASSIVSVSEDHKLVASWVSTSTPLPPVGQEVTVTFDSNGGSYVNSETVKYGDNYGKLPIPTRDGYTFDGWYFNGTKVTSQSKVNISNDHTLIAKWSNSTPDSDKKDNDVQGHEFPTTAVIAGLLAVILASITIMYIFRRKNKE